MGLIWCMHGFLGRGADWDFLRDAGFEIRAPSLFQGDSLEDVQPSAGDILLGYSMGARLALHLMQTHEVSRAVFVSAGVAPHEPGREELDDTWARRFESEPWDSVLEAWNSQSVFGGRKNPLTRNESDFDRHALATALREWSPAALKMDLREITVPTLWMAGEEDPKYRDAARRAAAQLPRAELWICPDAGHRVPWERPERFIARLREFFPPR
jgi:2-succinyl-6-hydroxy-2,4-cyclohexadiene-1-carboxylate synthase